MNALLTGLNSARNTLLTPTNEVERSMRNAMVLLVAAAFTLIPHFAHLPSWISLAATALLLVRGWLTLKNRPAPPKWLLISLAVIAGIAVWGTFGRVLGRDAGVACLVLLAGFKLLEMRARRDLFVVVFLCFFLLLTQFLSNQSFTVFVTGVLALLVLVGALTLFHAGAAPALMLITSLKDSLRTLAIAAPLALMAFLLFPRMSSPLWGVPQGSLGARTGLSDSMSPGSITSLAQSDELAFRVRFEGEIPAQKLRYFRGPVLANFDGKTWWPITEFARSTPQAFNIPETVPRYTQEIILEPHQRQWIFALEQAIQLPMVNGEAVRMTHEGTLLARRAVVEKVRYTMVSAATPIWATQQDQADNGFLRAEYLRLPAGFNPRTLQFAEQLLAQLGASSGDPRPFIEALLRHFRTQGFSYTLEPPELGTHSVDQFLFETKAGFCEHYTHAFVVLMRSLGFPARVVTGYLGGEVNPVDNHLTVQQRDAHAWAEVWVDRQGWLRVDPTAAVDPSRIESGFGASFPQRSGNQIAGFETPKWMTAARNWMVAAGTFWNNWVVGFGNERQRQLFGSLGMPDLDWRKLAVWLLGAGGLGMLIIWLMTRPRKVALSQAASLRAQLMKGFEKQGLAAEPQEDLRVWAKRIESQLTMPEREMLTQAIIAFEAAVYAPATNKKTSWATALGFVKQLQRVVNTGVDRRIGKNPKHRTSA